jgi:hypothetical protein
MRYNKKIKKIKKNHPMNRFGYFWTCVKMAVLSLEPKK